MRNPVAMRDETGLETGRFRLRECLAAACRTARRIVLLALLPVCLFAAPATAEDLPDTPANRYLAAEAYLKVSPLDPMVEETTGELLKVISPEHHAVFRESMNRIMDRINLEELTINALVKHFTVKEINAMTAFYGSPEGQSILRKFPVYMKEIMPQIMRAIPAVVKEVEGRDARIEDVCLRRYKQVGP